MNRLFEDLRSIIMKELEDIVSRGELDDGTLMCVDKLVDIIKDIDEIEGHESGYSNTGTSRYNRMSYDNYSRGRGGMGRFENSFRGGYSRDGSTIEKLNRMMNEASSDMERDVLRRVIDSI